MSLFSKLVELDPDELEAMLSQPGLADEVYAEWAALVADDARCAELAETQAYRHPNGFAKVTVAVGRSGAAARLHFWNAGYRDANPHSHRWDFHSRILQGAMENVLFTREPGDAFVECEAISPRDPAQPYVHTPQGRVGLRRSALHRLTGGDSYAQAYDAIHVTCIPADTRTVSLMVTQPQHRAHSYAYVNDAARIGVISVGRIDVAGLRSLAT